MTKLINEAKRFQELAGINEVKIQLPKIGNIVKFLNVYKDEVQEKIFNPTIDFYEIKGDTTYEEWEEIDPSYGGKPGIATTIIEGDVSGMADIWVSFEPFDEEYVEDAEYSNENPIIIAGQTVYINSTNNF